MLPIPDFIINEVVNRAIPTIRDPELSDALRASIPSLEAAEAEYRVRAANGELYLIPEQEDVAGLVSQQQMAKLYAEKVVRARSPGRAMYDAIKSAPPHGICPICEQRVVATLDHYLPKDRHPALAVTPINLVPACIDCNFLKRAFQAAAADQQTLHPYFDVLPEGAWLEAELVETMPPALVFRATPPEQWPNVLRLRVAAHFQLFGLAQLFAAQASAELVDISRGLIELLESSGAQAVHAHLELQYRSRAAQNVNSWKSAMYRALADSPWFHAAGLRLFT